MSHYSGGGIEFSVGFVINMKPTSEEPPLHAKRRLTPEDVQDIKAKLKSGMSVGQVAIETNRSKSLIYRIRRDAWKPSVALGRPPKHVQQKAAAKAKQAKRDARKQEEKEKNKEEKKTTVPPTPRKRERREHREFVWAVDFVAQDVAEM